MALQSSDTIGTSFNANKAERSNQLSRPQKFDRQSFLLRRTGFTGYSKILLFLSTAGFFSLFCAVTMTYLKSNWTFDAPLTNGERFWFLEKGVGKWLNQIHLWSVLPAGVFLPLQFVPGVRRRFVTLHRYAGRMLFVMLTIGSFTGLRMSFHSFGGTTHTILYAVILAITCSFGTYKSVTSIRRLEIDQHRIWTLRTWSYACSILSLRVVLVSTLVISAIYDLSFRFPLNCAQIEWLQYNKYNDSRIDQELDAMRQRYPTCFNLSTPAIENFVPVIGRIKLSGNHAEEPIALFNTIFGASGLIGLLFNVIGVEWYIYASRTETERLKKISAVRRKAAGLEDVGKSE